MTDPFAVLIESLQPVFRLEPIRNNQYTCAEVEQLKNAIENYNSEAKYSFFKLLSAVKDALPFIERRRVQFDVLRQSIDELSRLHQTPSIDWGRMIAHPKVSQQFQFSALHDAQTKNDLNSWLKAKTDKSMEEMDSKKLTQAIVDYREKKGFSILLNNHLQDHPDFLFNLIMQSKKNFIKISQTRLILYLTDEQIAHAIIQHLPKFIRKNKKEPFAEVEHLTNNLNKVLSKGRSISTLLRNTAAKSILNNSVFFQIYQTEEYALRHDKKESGPEVFTPDPSPKKN